MIYKIRMERLHQATIAEKADRLSKCTKDDLGQILTLVTLMRSMLNPFSKWGTKITDAFGDAAAKRDPLSLRDRVLEIVGEYLKATPGERFEDALKEPERSREYFDKQK
jgi:hypothetical protein